MATITKGETFGATETITATKLHNLVDNATVTGIVNADISDSASIDSTKINLSLAGYLTTGGNLTITGTHTYSTAPVLPAGTIDAITEIASGLKSGSDTTLITGTKGTTNNLAKWNADGDLVDGYEVLDEDDMASDSATKLATQQSIKAYVDTEVSGVEKSLGNWASATEGSAKQASSDGFLVVYTKGHNGLSQGRYVQIKTDGSNPPTTIRAKFTAQHTNHEATIFCPVKSGDYYLIETDEPINKFNSFWIPLS